MQHHSERRSASPELVFGQDIFGELKSLLLGKVNVSAVIGRNWHTFTPDGETFAPGPNLWAHKCFALSFPALMRTTVMATQDEYRRNATHAQKEADRARNEMDRASWLRIAQGWLSLLKSKARTAEETFDQMSADKGTGQDKSKSSH